MTVVNAVSVRGEGRRHFAVMFAEHGEMIRIISAREATRQERRNYEERGF
jgi:uncharacterized DUF497 family protein